jgi:hypothetical protein
LGLEEQVKAKYVPNGLGILRNGLVVLGLLFVPTLEMFLWQTVSTVLFALLFKLTLNGI